MLRSSKILSPFRFAVMVTMVSVLSATCTKPKVHHLRSLPPSTFESRETFECYINGKAFFSKGIDSASLGTCTYRQDYPGENGFVFEITANMHENACRFASITIRLDSVQLKQGRSYSVGTPGTKKSYASYVLVPGCNQTGTKLYTSDDLRAEVLITRFDPDKKIVVGYFDLRIKDEAGFVYRLSDGFFDRHFR